MALSRRIPCILFSSLTFLLLFSATGMSGQQSSIRITGNGSVMGIEASGVPLEELLRAISAKTHVRLKLRNPLPQTVSFSLKAMPVEEVFKRVLANQSYLLSFKKAADGRSVIDVLQVFGNRATGPDKAAAPAKPHTAFTHSQYGDDKIVTDDHTKKIERDRFIRRFSDTESLLKQMEAVPLDDGSSTRGIRITSMAENSAFRDLGLGTGDIVSDINGVPVTSEEQFVGALQSVPLDRPLVMIGFTRNGVGSSVYIHLR